MVNVLLWIIIATVLVSFISLIGVITLAIKQRFLNKILIYLVSLSIGALLGDAFIHLIPEASDSISLQSVFMFVLVGFLFFLVVEKFFHWRHCHDDKCKTHSFAYVNLFGDTVHNFIDGLIIAGSFLVDVSVGIASTLAIALHEIPQELGDFGVLIYAGFSRKKAIWWNFLTALSAVLGGFVGFFLFNSVDNLLPALLGFAAGGFVYIAASDLIPEVRKEMGVVKSIINFLMILAGLALMFLLLVIG